METKTKTRADHDGTTTIWLKKHRLTYTAATRHPFILSIRDGTVDISAFETWLVQDYVFVRAFAAFLASVLIKAWKKSDDRVDMEVILGGLAYLNDEIEWFKREVNKLGIHDLSEIVPLKTNLDYCRFLENLIKDEVEYTVAITAFWAIETVYQESFSHCLEEESKTPTELKEACQRWGNEVFAKYCRSIKDIADRRLEMASTEELKKAEEALLSVLELEVEFWNMSRGNPQKFTRGTEGR